MNDENPPRYRSQSEILAEQRERYHVVWWHYTVTGTLWRSVLARARAGFLAPNWRDTLAQRIPPHSPAADDPEAMHRMYGARHDRDALAVFEVASSPPADWEPGAAGGDWRRALSSWASTATALTRSQYTAKAWLAEQPGAVPVASALPALHSIQQRTDAVMEERELDAIEASYRAGLAAGGEASDWRGWLHARVSQSWSAADDSALNLQPTAAIVLQHIESNALIVPGAGMWMVAQTLPAAWCK